MNEVPNEGVTRTLARYVVGAQPADIPDAVTHEARRALLHWLGCSLGGCRHEAVEAALGRGESVDILLAALLNGISADVLGFSDTHLKTVIHAGGVIGPAVLALAERTRVSGKDFLHAFLLGIEVAC